MRKIYFGMMLPLVALASPLMAADESTIVQQVARIQYSGGSNNFYVVGAARWGASSCPNAEYVWVTADVPGRKELLALATAAQMSGKSVSFWGTCNADTNYFNAHYIVVQ